MLSTCTTEEGAGGEALRRTKSADILYLIPGNVDLYMRSESVRQGCFYLEMAMREYMKEFNLFIVSTILIATILDSTPPSIPHPQPLCSILHRLILATASPLILSYTPNIRCCCGTRFSEEAKPTRIINQNQVREVSFHPKFWRAL